MMTSYQSSDCIISSAGSRQGDIQVRHTVQIALLHESAPFFFSRSTATVSILSKLKATYGSLSFKSACNMGASCFNRLHGTVYLRSGLSHPRTSGKNRHSSKSYHHHRKHNDWASGHRTKQALMGDRAIALVRAETQHSRTHHSSKRTWTEHQGSPPASRAHSRLSSTASGVSVSAWGESLMSENSLCERSTVAIRTPTIPRRARKTFIARSLLNQFWPALSLRSTAQWRISPPSLQWIHPDRLSWPRAILNDMSHRHGHRRGKQSKPTQKPRFRRIQYKYSSPFIIICIHG